MVPRVLFIAGSDSSGGAGLEADQKAAAAHQCYAMTATTALTAQNTRGVYDIHPVPVGFLRKQIDADLEDVGCDVVKTGMLASADTIKTVARAVKDHGIRNLVVDPVMVATTGAQLLPDEAVKELCSSLLPQATVVTPNIPEAVRLLEAYFGPSQLPWPVRDRLDVENLAGVLAEQVNQGREGNNAWVLVKGGHCPFRKNTHDSADLGTDRPEDLVVFDILTDGRTTHFIQSPYQESRNTHGTGCSLASAIACNMAKGMDVLAAVGAAVKYVEAGIRTAPGLGKGNGPLNHFHSLQSLPFAPGKFVEYLLYRNPHWHRFVNHPFVWALGAGTLPLESFKGYLIQDYLFLVQFARANALASYKAKNMDDIVASASIVQHIYKEMGLHIDYCKAFGISKGEIERTKENAACTAYTRYALDIGQSQDWLGLQVSLAPCLLGYGQLAKQLHSDTTGKTQRGHGNMYWPWIENYVAEDYVTAVKTASELLERHAASQSPSRIEELVQIFNRSTEMEIGFWEMYCSGQCTDDYVDRLKHIEGCKRQPE